MPELSKDQLAELTAECVAISERAGEAIMDVYNSSFDVTHKDDKSPLTQADVAAHQIILQGLSTLEPEMPMISEESHPPVYSIRSSWPRYWLIDPLDGTREFVKRNGEFTVNIALIEGHSPIIGVVHAPVTQETWYASTGNGAWKQKPGKTAHRIETRHRKEDEALIIIKSRSHPGERLQAFLDTVDKHDSFPLGSSLKMCSIAEGNADLYPRLGLTSEWDTAAAHCVLKEAGGDITDTQMNTLRYNTKDSLLNPEFFAFGRDDRDWSQYLPAGD
jgi:3'(2'), 5'-bisphosphate nucleotidase